MGGGEGGREGRRRSGFLQTRDVVLLPPRRCNSVQTYLLAFHWAAVEQKARDLWTETTDLLAFHWAAVEQKARDLWTETTDLLAFHWAAVEQKARDLWTETSDSPAGLSGLFCFVRGKAGTVAAGASSACVPGFYLWNPVGAARMDT